MEISERDLEHILEDIHLLLNSNECPEITYAAKLYALRRVLVMADKLERDLKKKNNNKMICSGEGDCEKEVAWIRCTQFAGEHPYCEECAKKEEDFGKDDDSYFYWIEIKDYVKKRMTRLCDY
jgi:hypothetical protein